MSHIFFQDTYFTVYTDPAKQEISWIRTHNEALIVPVNDKGDVLLTIEPSPAFQAPTLLLPGGIVETNEEPEQAALRELQEEIGFTAARLDALGELRPWSKYLALQSFVYLARNLTPSRLEGDEGYPILVEAVPLADFERLIQAGRLLDARAIAALYLARAFLQTSQENVAPESPIE
ncbi:MAG TPA: NUDIX domain-containing protein [Ktedonobacterales bacterium]|nr:NUDIX domain-containing protein [Ktedonobacterales bacterium]